ncbi:MAG TPA: dockerin type I domain-containing protein [Lacipirellulaceae bacterium]|nr:dockerin type I domain-containing protein [Lacipirellulaceae bacterium]
MRSQLQKSDGFSLWISRYVSLLATVAVKSTGILSLTLLALLATSACADVQTVGVIDPAFNPFTGGGLPQFGNFIDPTEEPNPTSPSAQNQTNFEGLSDINVGQVPTSNVTPGFGEVLISSNTELRYENLIIGDQNMVNGQTMFGTGIFRIDGFGALFNNNPTILPFGLDYGTFGSKRPATVGFDMYVGKAGKGTLEISAGGRAEIQDAVLIGDESTGQGSVLVDGFDSFMGSGGFATGGSGGTGSDPHQMMIGRLGHGDMTISGGATVDSEAPPIGGGSNQVGPIGAVLGSSPYSSTIGMIPDPGGVGTTTVTGPGSNWIVGGTLQIGGFDIGLQSMTIGDLEGDNVQYDNQVGHGTLTVSDGGSVTVRNAIGVEPTDTTTSLIMAIGNFGAVSLDGGTINVGSIPNTGQQNQQEPDTIQIINDGVISGSGQINTGVFHNRWLGRVTVNAGQTLSISASAEFSTTGGNTPVEPLLNFGLIEAKGTLDSPAELDFVRSPQITSTVRPLINRPVFPNPPAGGAPDQFIGGMISAQWATLRSQSGIQNEGIMAFTAGTNIIQARVDQFVGPTGFAPQLVIGPNTTVIVEGDCFGCTPTFVGGGNTLEILDPTTYTSAGTINMQLSLANPNLISAAGDIAISGVIKLSFASDVLADLSANGPGRQYEIMSFSGGAYQTLSVPNAAPVPDYTKPLPDCSGMPLCAVPGLGVDDGNLDLGALLGPSFDNIVPVAQRLGNEIVISFLNPLTGGAMGPDFNGDGVIDAADFAIWQANVGISSGATVLQGDANGDGRVDGKDFLIWQRNVGKSPPWNGAGLGSGAGQLASVPEPTSLLLLLLCGGSLAMASGRRSFQR